jgi:hypothetical protein
MKCGIFSLWLFCLVFYTLNVSAENEKTSPDVKGQSVMKTIIIGSIIKNSSGSISAPSEYCVVPDDYFSGQVQPLEGDQNHDPSQKEEAFLYKGFDYRINKTNLILPEKTDAEAIQKAPIVMLTGTHVKDLTTVIQKIRPCNPNEYPVPQMRMDWASNECGAHPGITTLKRLKSLSYFLADEATISTAIQVKEQNGTIAVEITNPFDFSLPCMTFAVHFEGGGGKPQPRFDEYPIPQLDPHASFTQIIQNIEPYTNDKNKRMKKGENMFVSILLHAEVAQRNQIIYFTIDLPYYKMGLTSDYRWKGETK